MEKSSVDKMQAMKRRFGAIMYIKRNHRSIFSTTNISAFLEYIVKPNFGKL